MGINTQQEIDVLQRQVKSLRVEAQKQHEWLDTVNSPLYKRWWWWIGGYNFYTVGRWYPKETKRFTIWLRIAELIGCK